MKKKGNYIKKLAGEKEREVISYEDAPLDEIKDSEPLPANATKTFFKGFLILVISVVVVMAVTNIDKLTPENISHWVAYDLLGMSEGEGYPASFSGADVDTGNFDLMDGVPVYCSDTSITVLNSNAGKYQEVNHAFANPIFDAGTKYETTTEPLKKDKTLGKVEFRNVVFGYSGALDVIADISFTAQAGKTTAFIGTTGSGKTTVMNLMQGLYLPTFGDILIDDISIRNADENWLRSCFSYGTQRPMIFQDTVKNNISRTVSDERIKQACDVSFIGRSASEIIACPNRCKRGTDIYF